MEGKVIQTEGLHERRCGGVKGNLWARCCLVIARTCVCGGGEVVLGDGLEDGLDPGVRGLTGPEVSSVEEIHQRRL